MVIAYLWLKLTLLVSCSRCHWAGQCIIGEDSVVALMRKRLAMVSGVRPRTDGSRCLDQRGGPITWRAVTAPGASFADLDAYT